MRLVCFDDHRLGVLENGTVRDVSHVVDRYRHTPYAMNELIERWDELAGRVEEAAAAAAPLALETVRLGPPVPRPRNLLAAPLNYGEHVSEMVGSRHAPEELRAHHTPRELGFFAKAPGSISGPHQPIALPPVPGRSFHHEVELGVVVGREARALAPQDAPAHVFGYVLVLDITMRVEAEQQEERTMRKSFETFTPMGPCLVTADEVSDPGALGLGLRVNGELRQQANTADLLVGVDELIAAASHVLTLSPGDVYATGTPDGVGPITVGDTVDAWVDSVGSMSLDVIGRDW